MGKVNVIVLLSVIIAAVVLAGCTTTTTPTTQPGTPATATPAAGSPTQQATAPTANNNEKTWPVNSTHESGSSSMHGTVTLASGGPAAGYAVYIWSEGADEDKDPAFAMVRTDASGNYEFKNIPSGYYKPQIPHRAGDGGYGSYSRVHVDGDTVWDDTTQK